MKIYKILFVVITAMIFLYVPFTAEAQQPKFENADRIKKLCEEGYNSARKTKDCTCFVKKYKLKEMEMFKQRGTGVVPSYDNVFRLIDNECHINNETGNAKMGTCRENPGLKELTSAQMDTFCKCQAKAFSDMEVMFSHMPNASVAQKKEMTEQMSLAAKHTCKEQAIRKY